ncbi:hypothetical protein CPHLJ_5g3535 [Cryptosporidium parvum]|uniref:Mediator of RNA polymerase II transcription subunit 11 n=1 Tax=Cryptosporidium parvum TaxID=5807 RepID=A0A7S7RG17_CRYPV|nr:hypothetical protein CPATCC_0026290 [Cryptosporidium parvum]WKS78099.1 hypothetical protein CPCDC_5g3535 [Cryptosporidium sp. 43IA8]WRK32591.1 hypothetical protein cpbgf_5003533 [Cryptosporidium parvum]|eukprot:QOY41877.1 hypothetical protein CPATCC_002484 [Cryptosporidium parvum]
MSARTRCKETVNDCISKMVDNMNRIIEQSQISTLEGTAYDSYLSSFSMKIQIHKIIQCCQKVQQVAAEITLSDLLNDPKHKFNQVQLYKEDYLSKMSKIDNFQI